jgi:hypothetical protein
MSKSTRTNYEPPRSVRAKYDRIVALVRANPGATEGRIKSLYYADKSSDCTRQRFGNMLLELCVEGRLKCHNINCYTAVEESKKYEV